MSRAKGIGIHGLQHAGSLMKKSMMCGTKKLQTLHKCKITRGNVSQIDGKPFPLFVYYR